VLCGLMNPVSEPETIIKMDANLLIDAGRLGNGSDGTLNPNALPTALTAAARALAKRPRRVKRKWSGFVQGKRVWRNREIELSDGRRAYIYGVVRGRVGWSLHPIGIPKDDDTLENWGLAHESAVRLVRNPHAQLLGRRKAGIRERPSAAKAAAARVNGQMPPRPGSRPRGRPRNTSFNSQASACDEKSRYSK